MKTIGHLNSYQAVLTVESPLFIGSGEQASKKEYLYLMDENKVLMLDLRKLADYLDKKQLLERYQSFMLDDSKRNIYNFFRDNGIGKNEYRHFTDYTLDGAGEDIVRERLSDVKLFIKDGQGQPYIPGSSVKGALRTAVLTKILLEDKGLDRKNLAKAWLESVSRNQNAGRINKNAMSAATNRWESSLLNTLNLSEAGTSDAVNSIMRGIAVSDSAPLKKEQLMLAQKIDRSTAGKDRPLPISRECLRPGSTAQLTITIDQRIAKQTGWTIEKLLKAVRWHSQWQQENFYKHFKGHEQCDMIDRSLILWLGGGVGFANKTINQAAIGPKYALEFNAQILGKLFPLGNHDKDLEIGISPHMQKMAKYQGKLYRMGQCRLEVR